MMKKILLTLSVFVLSVSLANAQSLLHRTSESVVNKKVDKDISALTNQLKLNENQQKQISDEFESYYEKKNSIIQSDMSSRKKRKEIKYSLEKSLDNIENYLTDAQTARFDDIKRNRMRHIRKKIRNAPRRQ